MKIEKGFFKGPLWSLLIGRYTPNVMQCRIISQFPEDRQMWREYDRLDQQREPQETLKETTGEGTCPDN